VRSEEVKFAIVQTAIGMDDQRSLTDVSRDGLERRHVKKCTIQPEAIVYRSFLFGDSAIHNTRKHVE
jgi:hypothetical protein